MIRRSIALTLALWIALPAIPPHAHAQNSAEDAEFQRAVVFGKRFFDIQDYRSAYEHFLKADAIHPDQPGVLYNMAVILTKLQRYSEAQAKLDRYVQLYPTGAEMSLVSKLQFELEFQREVQRKRQMNHDYIEMFNRGKFQFGKGDIAGALKVFQDAEQQRRDDPAPVYNQAVTFEKQGEFLKATERYRRYLEIHQAASDKAAVNQKIFALETEIDDMRTKTVCTFCGEKLPVGSIWCHRCWNGPYLTTAARWNTRVCGTGATAVRLTAFADGRVAKNEDLACTLKSGNFHQSVMYTPTKQKEIQNRRKSEGWTYTNGVISSRTDAQGSQVKLEQGDYLQRVLSITTGEVLHYSAHKAPNGIWQLDREELVIDGQKYVKHYAFDAAGRIAQERVVYQNNTGCNHVITMTADYVYDGENLTQVKFRSSYDGLVSEGLPQTRWEGVLNYTLDASGRVEKEDFAVASHTKTFQNKPTGEAREDVGKIYPGYKVKKPTDIIKRGDICRLASASPVGNPIDLRPFYTISPNIATLLPFGVTRITVSFNYPEGFVVASK